MFKNKINLRNVIVITVCLAASFPQQMQSASPTGLEGIGNVTLPNTFTREYEKIVLDPSKYTLLAFSATTCAPCIRMIPTLRQIHEATRGYMNLVYITLDNHNTIGNWNALMERESIEWRSLWLTNRDLIRRWRAGIVPSYVLVAPNGYAKRISLRFEDEVQELFSIIGAPPVRVQTPWTRE